jgi:hypothetical protein
MACKVREYSGQRVLWPADSFTREWIFTQPLESLHWVSTHRPRSPQFHRAVHRLCSLLAEHTEAFSGMDPHRVLKRIQLEAKICLDEIAYQVRGYGTVIQAIPASISFESMDQAEFREFTNQFCDYVAATYWPEFSLDLLERAA